MKKGKITVELILRTFKNFSVLAMWYLTQWASLVTSLVKNPPANAGDWGSIPGSGRSPDVGNGYLLQYSCLGNSINRGAWWATVHVVAESDMTEVT